MEWTPKGSDDPETAAALDLDSRAAWRAANPGIGFRDGLDLESLTGDREGLDDDSFGRECLSIWPTESEVDMDATFGPGAWGACSTAEAPPSDGVTLGLAVSIDRAYASIGAAGELGGQVHIGPVTRDRYAKAWVVERLVELDRPVVVDGRGPAADLIDDLEDAGVEVLTASTGEVLDACAGLFDAVQERRVVHGSYPELDAAVGGAQKRLVGDRWAWGRKISTADVSMLEAVTLAAWGCEQTADYDLLASIA